VALIDGALSAPAQARQDNPQQRGFVLGDLAGRESQALEQAAAALSDFGEVRVTSNIRGELWAKLVHNCMMNAVCTLTGRNAAWILRDPVVWPFARALEAEAVRVALAHGVELGTSCLYGCAPQDFVEEAGEPRVAQALRAAYPETGDLYPSMVQDVWKGRPTEIEYMNGFIVGKGKEAGIETPRNAAITALIHRIERGELAPDAANKNLLQDASADAEKGET
jgi:2-dehydropantoate 2-reductase